jgi:hypothetical protein
MATKLNKPVARESAAIVHEGGRPRQIVVTLEPPYLLGFRAKGCRKTYYLTADACYSLAVKAHLLDEKRQKAKKRKQRGKVKALTY